MLTRNPTYIEARTESAGSGLSVRSASAFRNLSTGQADC